MFPAINSFLSALSFSFKISIFVSETGWEKAGTAVISAPMTIQHISLDIMIHPSCWVRLPRTEANGHP
jgi:hypothetical protein